MACLANKAQKKQKLLYSWRPPPKVHKLHNNDKTMGKAGANEASYAVTLLPTLDVLVLLQRADPNADGAVCTPFGTTLMLHVTVQDATGGPMAADLSQAYCRTWGIQWGAV